MMTCLDVVVLGIYMIRWILVLFCFGSLMWSQNNIVNTSGIIHQRVNLDVCVGTQCENGNPFHSCESLFVTLRHGVA